MKKLTGLICATALMGTGGASAGALPGGDSKVTIDPFTQASLSPVTNPGTPFAEFAAPFALGGQRDLELTDQGFATVGGGVLFFSGFVPATELLVTWDGLDASSNVDIDGLVDPLTGLGVDLGFKGLYLQPFGESGSNFGYQAQFVLWDAATGNDYASSTHAFGDPDFSYFRFSEFGSSVDPSNIGAIQLRVSSSAGANWGGAFDYVTAVPVPAPLALMGAGLIGLGFFRRRIPG